MSLLCLFALAAAGCRDPDSYLDPYVGKYRAPAPGAAVMVLREGRPVLVRTYGIADLKTGEPVTAGTSFRLASMTKQFTATAIMKMAEMGALNLDESLKNVFPDFPEYGRAVRIRHLLSHTSGLLDYESLMSDSVPTQVLDRDVLDIMRAQDSTYFPPGSAYRYSNTGYAVLAMVVEARSGQSFAGFLSENVFEPAGMHHTVAFEQGVSEVHRRALGYTVHEDTVSLSDQSPTSAVLGDGGIYSSLTDLAAWDRALHDGTVLPVDVLAEMWTPAAWIVPDSLAYGFGWRIDSYRGRRRIHHTGSTSGFRNVIQRYPDDDITIIILTNRRDPDVSAMADHLADHYLSGT